MNETLARLRFEMKRWKERARVARSDARDCRRRKDFLGAIKASERAREYSRSAEQWKVEIAKLTRTA